MTSTRRVIVLAVSALAFCIAPSYHANASSALDEAAVQQIITMAKAGLSEQVILAKAEQVGAFPVLSGDDLAELKTIGVTDSVLVFMIEHAQKKIDAAAAAPAPSTIDETAAEQAPATGIRVVIDRGTRITYYEVAIDSEIVHHSGKLWEGKSDPGIMLRRPRVLRGDAIFNAYEATVEPGAYDVSIGYAFSSVEGDPRDEWGEYEGEWYVTRGIRAVGTPLSNQKEGDNPGAVCEVAEGLVCEVTVRLEGQRPTPLGGLPDYSISYDTRIID